MSADLDLAGRRLDQAAGYVAAALRSFAEPVTEDYALWCIARAHDRLYAAESAMVRAAVHRSAAGPERVEGSAPGPANPL